MNNNIKLYSDVLDLKYMLINHDKYNIEEVYKNKYNTFINATEYMLNNEKGFYLLDPEYLTSTINITSKYSNNINNELYKLEGTLKDEEDEILFNYLIKQEEKRKLLIENKEDLIRSLEYDREAFYNIMGNDTDINKRLFPASVNAFLEDIPEIFRNKSIRDNTMNKLESIKRFSLFNGNRNINKVKNKINKMI